MEIPNSISRQVLWYYILGKINNTIHHAHVFSVMSILFEEILNIMISGNELKIINFGTLILKKMGPRLHHNVRNNTMVYSGGNKSLKFSVAPKIRNKLCNNLDIDRTFNDD